MTASNKILNRVSQTSTACICKFTFGKRLFTYFNLFRNRAKDLRNLEIGPGRTKLVGFEALNIEWTGCEDYLANASDKLPFADGEFDLIYASHILEHIPWYLTHKTLSEWHRILKGGGTLEVWVPDGLKICQALVDYERHSIDNIYLDNWYKFNEDKDPARWACGRLFTYGDGSGKLDHPNWHRGLFTPRFLIKTLEEAGFQNVTFLDRSRVRGHDHGWINLGISASKL